MRAWRRGDARRTLQLLTRPGLTPPRAMLAARAAIALGRPDAAYSLLGSVRAGAHADMLELIRAEAAEALGQLTIARAHAAAAGRFGALSLARLARLGGVADEAQRRLMTLGDHPLAALERALLTGLAEHAKHALPRLRDPDARTLARALSLGPDGRGLSLLARSARADLSPALRTLASGDDADDLGALGAAHRRTGRRWAYDLFVLAHDRAGRGSGAVPRVACDGSWLEVAGAERVSLRRRPRVRRALEALAQHPAGIEPEVLFDHVWDEPRPTHCVLRNRVDVTLARLRATGLGGHLERRRGLVRLIGVDVAERVAS